MSAKRKRGRNETGPAPGREPLAGGKGRAAPTEAESGRPVLLALVLLVVTAVAYGPTMTAGFSWDDNAVLTENPMIKAGDGLYRFWFTKEPTDYFPLMSTTLWLEWRMWGNNPAPYHCTNVLLHALSAVLLWRVLKRLQLPGAYLAGLIFAVHPVTVSSVAWITERKNTLSMLLYLAAVLAYLRFEDGGKRRSYASALVLFVLALLTKTSVVMLPFVLLLLAWWRRGRVVRNDLIRSVPFFAASLVLGLVTVWFQYERSILAEVVRPEGPLSRLAAAGWSVWFYLYKLLLPVRLGMIYPRWDVDGSSVLSFVPLVLLLAGLAVLWANRKRWARGLLCALAYFLVTLVPVLGPFDMSFMKYSLVADHFQYVPMLGMVALFAAGLTTLAGRVPGGEVSRFVAGSLLVLVLAVLTARQAGQWKDQETLWTQTIALNDRAWVAYYSRGLINCRKGEWDKVIQDCTKAIELKPDYVDAYNNRSIAYGSKGNVDLMIQDCTKAIELKPDYVQAYNTRIFGYFRKGLYDQAWADVATYRRLGGKLQPAFMEELSKASGGRRE